MFKKIWVLQEASYKPALYFESEGDARRTAASMRLGDDAVSEAEMLVAHPGELAAADDADEMLPPGGTDE